MDLAQQLSTLHVAGKMEGYKNDLRMLCSRLSAVSFWRPGAVLQKQCKDGIRMIEDLEARFHRKLVVTLIGPSGSGKSTLLNALAGVDDLSDVGHQRPTTRGVIAFSKDEADAAQLIDRIGRDAVTVKWQPGAASLNHVILLDTPDTDSMSQDIHIPIIQKAISLSDVLICVFDAENPKRRDHADFLSSYMGFFGGNALVVVVNKCDRQEKEELLDVIMPDFSAYLSSAWGRSADAMLCTSGRQHLKDPKWDENAGPKHDLDQFPMLREMVFGTMDQAGYVVDQRLDHAKQLCRHLAGKVKEEAKKDEKNLAAALTEIRKEEKNAIRKVLSTLKENDSTFLGVNVLLYQKLAQRWLGPMGWIVAIWARLLLFGAGAAAVFRFGHPIRQIWGVLSSFKQLKESRKAVADSRNSDYMAMSMGQYQLSLMKAWPNIAKLLVKSRCNGDVQQVDLALPDFEKLKETLSLLWQDALSDTIDTAARKLSHGFLQLLFNIPTLAILGYTAWLTLQAFYQGNYLSSDFFLHAFLTIGIILFFCFFIFQAIVRIAAGGDRVISKTFESVKSHLEMYQPVSMNPVETQIATILELARMEDFE
jgi:energy-coupling factor transporter ATP-binding protein EcfA2